MSYNVIFDPGAAREFGKLTQAQRKHVGELIDGLAESPRPPGAEKLTDVAAYRIRAGDYRVIYSVKDELLIVLIVRVGDRRDVYKDIATIRRRLKK